MPRKSDPFKILHLSDTHISSYSRFISEKFLKAVKQINRLKVDYLIHTGDVTEEGTKEDYELVKKLLSKIEKDVIYIIGNHDARNVGYELFEEYLGPKSQVIVDDDVLIASFDTTIPDRDGGRFGATSLKKLKKILGREGEGRTKIVAFHHHLLPMPKAGRERSMIVDAGDVLTVILDYNVDLVLNGHRHTPNSYKIEDTMVVNSGTISNYKTRAGEGHSFNLIEFTPRKTIEIKVFNVKGTEWRRTTENLERGDRLVKADGDRIAKIVQISDTHFVDSSEFLPKTYLLAVQRINQLNPDLVVHCGDVTHDGLPRSFDRANTNLKRINSPQLILPGPHDLMHLGHILFKEKIGKFNPVVRGNNFVVHGVNSSQYDEMNGRVGRTLLHRLIQKISEGKEDCVEIVALHHHLLPLPHTREKYPIEDAGDVLKQLLEHKVDMILTGHRHVSYSQKIAETVVVNANTLSSRRFQARYGNTFNLIDILSNGTAVVSEIAVITGMRRILGIYKLPTLSQSSNLPKSHYSRC